MGCAFRFIPHSPLPVLAEVHFASFGRVLADIDTMFCAQTCVLDVCSGILAELQGNV
jgi:hypothetical protein